MVADAVRSYGEADGIPLPRRHHRSLAELADAVRLAPKALGAVGLVLQGEAT